MINIRGGSKLIFKFSKLESETLRGFETLETWSADSVFKLEYEIALRTDVKKFCINLYWLRLNEI